MPHIPTDAPFNIQQRMWLDGFISGLHSQRLVAEINKSPESQQNVSKMDILYGTQTGNAESLANDAASIAESRGYKTSVHELDSVDMQALSNMEHALIVVSTYGEGEMPDNAQIFWDAVQAETAPRLEKLNYAVLALGDTSYDEFCHAGKLIDTRLEQLGALRMSQRIDCDVDYETPAATWLDETILPANIPSAVSNEMEVQGKSIQKTETTKPKWNKKNPFISKIIENNLLSGQGSAKEIRHLSFDLSGSDIKYEAGDALGIVPKNANDLVEKILDRLNKSFDDAVEGFDKSIGQLLTSDFEIMSPSRDLVYGIEKLVADRGLSDAIKAKEKLEKFLWGKDILDLLNLNSDLKIDPMKFLNWLKPLQHRAYSISSSPNVFDKEVHLTVAAVRWNYNDREHKGVASTFLADDGLVGATAGIFLLPNKNFRVPKDDSAPMIMVGPGTGIAPFRAFLQERQIRGASGENWLFFGDQHRKTDFLYENELNAMSNSGFLSRFDLAFSRDQAEKIYVQNKMIEQGKNLFGAIEEGGCFYVCGDASRMAKDVDKTLHQIISEHGGLSPESTSEYVKNLKRDKRYLRDVY
ncbi:MAG: sulfite reductase subunit alpha [Rhodospirillaceae bacterium]|nr:sulfite reductase subunit alpha [Rhodospirillaceae bacterium]